MTRNKPVQATLVLIALSLICGVIVGPLNLGSELSFLFGASWGLLVAGPIALWVYRR